MIVRKTGAIKHLSTFIFESKHRDSKLSANVIVSRVNVSKILAHKHQLQFCEEDNFQTWFYYFCNSKQWCSIECYRDAS